jgi:hypothetical protein
MAYPKDENGRYYIPAARHEARVEADCDCGWALNAPERVWDYLSGRHAHAHNKGIDGLAAGGSWDVRHIAAGQPEPEPEAGREPELEAG